MSVSVGLVGRPSETALDTSRLPLELLDVIDSRLPNLTADLYINAIDHRRMHEEVTIDPDTTCRNFPNHECRIRRSLAKTNHSALEGLEAELWGPVLIRPFKDLHIHRHRVTGAEVRKRVLTEKLRFELSQNRMLHLPYTNHSGGT
jgi:hypothetical protein